MVVPRGVGAGRRLQSPHLLPRDIPRRHDLRDAAEHREAGVRSKLHGVPHRVVGALFQHRRTNAAPQAEHQPDQQDRGEFLH